MGDVFGGPVPAAFCLAVALACLWLAYHCRDCDGE